MEILIKAFIAFGLAFLIIAFLHWLVNKNNEKNLYKHGNAVDGYNSPTGDFNVPETETEEYEYQGDKTIVRRKKDERKR
jgi:hypothetical protein|tara:strand:+ start:630 stop:866 length:237 start_codon:yes stop_codon:yes gene_type:complete